MSRNVEHLKALLMPARALHWDVVKIAHHLAEHGVLAVDSLTDEQAASLTFWHTEADKVRNAESVRAALRRCATGEPQ